MTVEFVRLIVKYGFNEREAVETPMRGYLTHVWVELSDGSLHEVSFFDPVRLGQELASDQARGRPFFSEPGLIIVPEVTMDNMEAAARTLAREGFFSQARSPAR